MPKLTVKSPEFAGRVFQLNDAKLTVGRADDNTLVLEHPSVSSHHAELHQEGGDYKLVDLNSTNGTRVNDERVTETVLRSQDVVMLGNILLSYESDTQAAAAPLPSTETKVDLSGSSGSGRPQVFKNLAPFSKPREVGTGVPMLIWIGGLIALAGVGYLAFTIFLV